MTVTPAQSQPIYPTVQAAGLTTVRSSLDLLELPYPFSQVHLLTVSEFADMARKRRGRAGRRLPPVNEQVLEELHRQRFTQWRRMGRDRQTRDLQKHLETSTVTIEKLKQDLDPWVRLLMPASLGEAASCLLAHDFAMVLTKLAPEETVEALSA